MFPFNGKCKDNDEKRICALCEFSTEEKDGFRCGKRKVDAVHSCRKFIYDPMKRKTEKVVFNKDDFTFEPLE